MKRAEAQLKCCVRAADRPARPGLQQARVADVPARPRTPPGGGSGGAAADRECESSDSGDRPHRSRLRDARRIALGRCRHGIEYRAAAAAPGAGRRRSPPTRCSRCKARSSLRTADRPKGNATLLEVAKRVRAAPGPDAWSQALFTLEAIARTARTVGDWELAGQIARQMIEHDPAYAGSHYALALVAEHDDDDGDRENRVRAGGESAGRRPTRTCRNWQRRGGK